MPLRADNRAAPVVIPASAFAGVNSGGNPENPDTSWMPACAGMTGRVSVFVSRRPLACRGLRDFENRRDVQPLSLTFENDDAVIQPRKGKSDPAIGPDALMVVISQDLVRLSKRKPMDGFDQGFFKIFRGKAKKEAGLSLAGPFLGAPQAAMVMEKIIALGAERICLFGWCGSLQPDLEIGDLVIPLHAIAEEGTSKHYPIGKRKPSTDPGLNRILERALEQEGLPFR
jgi:hypothetical protein